MHPLNLKPFCEVGGVRAHRALTDFSTLRKLWMIISLESNGEPLSPNALSFCPCKTRERERYSSRSSPVAIYLRCAMFSVFTARLFLLSPTTCLRFTRVRHLPLREEGKQTARMHSLWNQHACALGVIVQKLNTRLFS